MKAAARALACLLAVLGQPAAATSPPLPGQPSGFPPFDLDGPGEHLLFSSLLVSTGPCFFSAVTSEGSSADTPTQRQAREDAAAFVASHGQYRSAALEAALRERRRAGQSASDLELVRALLVAAP